MPIFTYVLVVGSALIALLFIMDVTVEKGAPPIVTSERQGLPKPWHPDPIQVTATPAPAPDMTRGLYSLLSRKSRRLPRRNLTRRPRRSALLAGGHRTSTGRATAGRESHSAGSSAAIEYGVSTGGPRYALTKATLRRS